MDRPRHIDLQNTDFRAPGIASKVGLPSPRIQHFDGEVPPALSPLDAFAAHSRRLAKELEETRIAGQRRLSRLPPQLVTKSLTQHQASRPAIFRSLSANSQEEIPPVPQIDQDYTKNSPEITSPSVRPKSAYPRISAVLRSEEEADEHEYEEEEGRFGPASTAKSYGVPVTLHQTSHPSDYFGVPRSQSPIQEHSSDDRKNDADGKGKSQLQSGFYHGLAPPNAAFARSKGYNESSEDDYASSTAGSYFSQARKLSSSSGVSAPQSPAVAHQRTPSNNSTTSLTGPMKLPPHLNFSRPRSSASLHSRLDSPTVLTRRPLQRKHSHASELDTRGQTSFDDTRSVMSDGVLANESSSYTHSKFSLPRGRVADRTSTLFSALSTPHFEWSEPMFPSTPPLSATKDSFKESLPQTVEEIGNNRVVKIPERGVFSFDVERRTRGSFDDIRRPSSSGQGASVRLVGADIVRPSTSHGASHGMSKQPSMPPVPASAKPTSWTELNRSLTTISTVRPSTSTTAKPQAPTPAEDHVTKAIEMHQHGDLKESTYHLRIAAKQNDPTGMLLYALACRHGWGIRPNPKDAVMWLKKAVDTAMLEVQDDEEPPTDRPRADYHEKKAHRAQFALSIYELGISHLNGWGVEQDKALALRCFEIAGKWGDPDALTEAGFCYAEGIGCKKDLKKAASFYRRAADKGVSMVGNSWIYKDKYNDPNDNKKGEVVREGRSARKASSNDKEKVQRSKSRTRSIFGRKKSTTAAGPT